MAFKKYKSTRTIIIDIIIHILHITLIQLLKFSYKIIIYLASGFIENLNCYLFNFRTDLLVEFRVLFLLEWFIHGQSNLSGASLKGVRGLREWSMFH